MNEKCKWKFEHIPEEIDAYAHYKGRYAFHTSCGNFSETIMCHQPEYKNIYKFCPFCGKEIQQEKENV